MEQLFESLEKEIKVTQGVIKNWEEAYQLLSSYNAFNILLLNAKAECEKVLNKNYSYTCYENQIDDLFAVFNSDECLSVKPLNSIFRKEKLFLFNQDTLLRIYCSTILAGNRGDLSNINYKLLKASDCQAKVYKQKVLHSDPAFCTSYYEEENAFGLFSNGELIAPSYELNEQLKSYDNKYIGNILKVKTLDEIQEGIKKSKDVKVKELTIFN